MPINPVTLEWEEDEPLPPPPLGAPPPIPGALPPPTFGIGEGGAAHGTAPPAGPPPPIPPASTAAPTAPGILQGLDVTQNSTGTSSTSNQKSESSGKVRTPEVVAAQKELDAAQGDLAKAAEARAKADRAAAERDLAKLDTEAAVARWQANDAKQALEEKARIQQEGEKVVNVRLATEQALAAKDNAKFLDDASTTTKIAWGIGLLLGAFGAIKTGRNAAAEMLSDAVNKWDGNNRLKLEAARKGVQDARTWADKRTRDFLDEELKAAPLKKAAALLSIADQVERELGARKGQITADAAAKALEGIGKLRADAAKLRADTAKDFAPTATTGASTSTTDRAGTMVQTPGTRGTAQTQQKSLAEARKAVAAHQRINKIYDKLVAHVNEFGDLNLSPSERKNRNQLVANLKAELKGPDVFNFGAALTPNEEKILDTASGNPDNTSIIDQVPRIESGRNLFRDRGREKLQGLGYDRDEADKALDQDPAGLSLPASAAPPRAAAPTDVGRGVRALSNERKPASGGKPVEERQQLPSGGYAVKRGGKWVPE